MASCTPTFWRKSDLVVVVWHGKRGDQALELRRSDVNNIRSVWEKLTSMHGRVWRVSEPITDNNLWVKMLKRIFTVKPSLKKALGLENTPDEALSQDFKFRWHCQNFANFWSLIFSAVIGKNPNSLRVEEEVVNEMGRIGWKHSQNPDVAFDEDTWLLFKTTLLEGLCGSLSGERDDKWSSLNKVLVFAISEIKGSFLNDGTLVNSEETKRA